MKSLLLMAFLLTGCGAYEGTGFMEPYDYDAYEVPEDFAPFVATFAEELKKRNMDIEMRPLVMKFAELPEDGEAGGKVLGQCTIYTVSAPKIEIDPNDWAKNDDYYWREFLIFHELGHCKLRREHNEVILSDGRKESVMYPTHLGKRYEINREYYLNELFSVKGDIEFGLWHE